MSHKLSSKEPELLQVPVTHNLPLKPSSDDYDSDFSDTYDVDDPDDLEEEEKALVTAYLHDPPALHIRRTLDQYYYHMLDNTKERDIDQVVSRWAQNMKSEARHNILMVDQLWLWSTHQKPSPYKAQDKVSEIRTNREQMGVNNGSKLDEEPQDHYVISCFPSRTGTGQHAHRVMDDLRLLVLDPTHRKRHPIRKPEDLTSRILETCCSVFDRLLDAEPLRFFQMFEESVGTIDDKESRLFRSFQRGSTHLMQLKATNKYYEERKNKLLVDLLDIREEVKLLVEIKDILDEINIILSVLDIQRTVIEQRRKAEGFTFLGSSAAEDLIKADIDDFKKLEGHSRTIQEKRMPGKHEKLAKPQLPRVNKEM
ncbi:uncharacterized protein J4E79_005423 [Alternaria viburni]|uniref:uncharacterized protein n=1 Tax=Alternaria viburni TaxID=566460 RepID=UPI0020C27189|nr:uncharacterized protein J4E79_005423 [Alternaria viburni]KAI4660855.1 hypothetical protein J4E79_005423 [Alternaria viburni]